MATGPAPKAEKHRRRGQSLGSTGANLRLPRGGRKGKLPRWPLEFQSDREKIVWRRLWKVPAAVAWEELGWYDTVARYCQVLVEADRPSEEGLGERSVVIARAEARQLEDRLGLSPMAMARLRWVIVDEDPEEQKEQAVDVRQRLRAM